MICGSRGSKSRLAKAAGAEPSAQISHEKLHAVVARSTVPSQNVQSTPASEHFWKLRCRKSARQCGAKHFPKSKVQKTGKYGELCEVQMLFCVAAARGTFEEDVQRCMSRGTHSTRDMFTRDVMRSGRWFPE